MRSFIRTPWGEGLFSGESSVAREPSPPPSLAKRGRGLHSVRLTQTVKSDVPRLRSVRMWMDETVRQAARLDQGRKFLNHSITGPALSASLCAISSQLVRDCQTSLPFRKPL
jgi:hypothetical protein